jgi:hypothetical protein
VLLTTFDENATKPYLCNLGKGESCFLSSVRDMAYLAGVKALVLFEQNKVADAQKIASNLVNLGKNVTANADAEITLLVGWDAQKTGYSVLSIVNSKNKKPLFSEAEKSALITQLRNEQKKVFRYGYTRMAEGIDYMTSLDTKPVNQVMSMDDEAMMAGYRKAIAEDPNAWNPIETKKYVYDSYKIMISNIDLPCGANLPGSKIETGFNPEDQKTENYIGKTMYSTGYAGLDAFSAKRCEVEMAIQNNSMAKIDNINPVTPPAASSPEITKQVNNKVRTTSSLPAVSLKTFTQSAGIYSVKYPSYWTYSEGQLTSRFQTVESGTSQTFDITLGVDMEDTIKNLSSQNTVETVTFGSNKFTKFTKTNDPQKGNITYILPIGMVDGHSIYVSVLIGGFTTIDATDFASFLASIKVYPSKATVLIKKQDTVATTAQIRANVSNMRSAAEVYLDNNNNTYIGLCDGTNEKTKEVHIDTLFNSTLKLVSARDVTCNASREAYIYSVHMPSGETVCADSTGFFGVITTTKPALLSCM